MQINLIHILSPYTRYVNNLKQVH